MKKLSFLGRIRIQVVRNGSADPDPDLINETYLLLLFSY